MVIRILVIVAASLALAGCGSSEDQAPVTTAAASGTEPTSTEQVADPADSSTEPAVWKAEDGETALLTAVRAARHPGYDRVVFEFRNRVPGYDVRYVEPPVLADGSGEEVEVAGNAVLLVRMEPALDADLTQESAPPTYTGPTRFSPDTEVVVELVRTGGFEGVLTWAIGVTGEQPFRVTRLENPARLAIDIETG
jgi:hypothetical protein